jgi:hypothetical protein
VLRSFAPDTQLRLAAGYVLVVWKVYNKDIQRRWMTRGQDFYPVWYRSWGRGGTASTALAQLVRWIQDKPVLPLTTWIYWGGDRGRLLRRGEGAEAAIAALRAAGYPEVVNCVLCGTPLTAGFDWWSLRGVSGPCCTMHNGCRQKGAV